MRYFKIRIGYGNVDDRYIQIDESELEVALLCFISDKKGVFQNGVCRGRDIISITEDWHREMGWSQGYNITAIDWAELEAKGIVEKYTGAIGEAKSKVMSLIENGQEKMIEKSSQKLLGQSKKDKELIKKQILECGLCKEYKGWIFDTVNGERIVRPCSCTILRKVEAPVQTISMPYKDHE